MGYLQDASSGQEYVQAMRREDYSPQANQFLRKAKDHALSLSEEEIEAEIEEMENVSPSSPEEARKVELSLEAYRFALSVKQDPNVDSPDC